MKSKRSNLRPVRSRTRRIAKNIAFLAGSVVILWALIYPAIPKARESRRRLACFEKMKRIMNGLQKYQSQHGQLPPVFLSDHDGKPIHSWRVLILPYIGHQKLYEQYDFSEPWNGPNNRKLLDQRPECYGCPSHRLHTPNAERSLCNYMLLVGKDSVFDSPEPRLDESNRQCFLIDVNSSSCPWTKPDDMNVDWFLGRFDQGDLKSPPESDSNHFSAILITMANGDETAFHDGASLDEARRLVAGLPLIDDVEKHNKTNVAIECPPPVRD